MIVGIDIGSRFSSISTHRLTQVTGCKDLKHGSITPVVGMNEMGKRRIPSVPGVRSSDMTVFRLSYLTMLRRLKTMIECDNLSSCSAVIAVPSTFTLAQRFQVERCGREVGFGDVDVVDSTMAVASAYADQLLASTDDHDHNNTRPIEFLVLDFGASVFEYSLFSLAHDHSGGHHRLSTQGSLADEKVTGIAFDDILVSAILSGISSSPDVKEEGKKLALVHKLAETAKKDLSISSSACIDVSDVVGSSKEQWMTVSLKMLESLSSSVLQHLTCLVTRVLSGHTNISSAILVGGTSRMSIIQTVLSKVLASSSSSGSPSECKLRKTLNAEEAVCIGACMYGIGKYKSIVCETLTTGSTMSIVAAPISETHDAKLSSSSSSSSLSSSRRQATEISYPLWSSSSSLPLEKKLIISMSGQCSRSLDLVENGQKVAVIHIEALTTSSSTLTAATAATASTLKLGPTLIIGMNRSKTLHLSLLEPGYRVTCH